MIPSANARVDIIQILTQTQNVSHVLMIPIAPMANHVQTICAAVQGILIVLTPKHVLTDHVKKSAVIIHLAAPMLNVLYPIMQLAVNVAVDSNQILMQLQDVLFAQMIHTVQMDKPVPTINAAVPGTQTA